jgi:hypothetical protein
MQSIEGIDEQNLYPVHESSTPPPSPEKYWQVHYLTGALQAHLTGGWIMSGSCLHYLEDDLCYCVTPDVAIVSGSASTPLPGDYTSWTDPPLLFAAEVEEHFPIAEAAEEGVPSYAELLQVPEFLYFDPPNRRLWLWRRIEGRYQLVPPDANGRSWSETLNLSFGCDETGFLRLYTAGGEMLLTHQEQVRQTQAEAQRRAEAERQLAELTAGLERLQSSRDAAQ